MLVLWNTASFEDAGPDVSVFIVLRKMDAENGIGQIAPVRVQANASEGECWVKSLDAGTQYSLTLIASSDGVESKPSNPVVVSTKAWLPGQVLSPPALVHAGPQRLQVKWPPAKPNGGAVLRYHVLFATDPEFEANVGSATTQTGSASRGAGICTTTLNGLTSTTTYYCKVRAENCIGMGEWSEASALTTVSPRAPAAPLPPAIADATTVSLLLRWPPPEDYGDPVTSYDVQVTMDIEADDWDTKESSQPSLMWDDLEADSGYHARVRAVNSFGTGLWSEWSRLLYTDKDVPCCPRNVKGTSQDDGSTELSWQTPSDNGMKVEYFIVRAFYEAKNPSDMSEPTEFEHPCPPEGTEAGATITFLLPPASKQVDESCRLQVAVCAVNALGQSPWAPWHKASRWSLRVLAEESVKTLRKSGKKNLPPARVACPVLASSRTSRKVNLSWPEPEDKLHHAKIDNMELRWSGVPREEILFMDDWWGYADKVLDTATLVTLEENAIKYALDDLAPGTTILAQVRTNCGSAGTGPWSALPDDLLDLEALTTEAETPDQVQTIEMEKAMPKGMILTWACPDPRGSSITQFQVEVAENPDMDKPHTYPQEGSWGTVGDAVKQTVTGLKYCTEYWVAIASFNHMGKSLRSEVQGPFCTEASAPGAAGRPLLKSMMATSLHFEYVAPDPRGAPIDAFEIRYARDPAMKMERKQMEIHPEQIPNSRMMKQILPDLAVSQTYYIQLRARNKVGWGAWTRRSQPMTTTVSVPERPVPPELVDAKPDALNLRWSEPEMNGSQVTQVRFLCICEKYREQFDSVIDGEPLPKNYDSLKASPDDGIAERIHPHCVSEVFRLTGLSPGRPYLVALRVFNAVGPSNWSVSSEPIWTAIRPPGRCSMPTPRLPQQSQSVALMMGTPPDDGGSPIMQVHFKVIQVDTGILFEESIPLQKGTAVITGLEPGEAYTAWIAAENKAGVGEWSEPLNFMTPAMVPDTPGTSRISGPRIAARPFLPSPTPTKRSIFDRSGMYSTATTSSASTRLPSTQKMGSMSGSGSPRRMKSVSGSHRKSKGSRKSERGTEGQKDRPHSASGTREGQAADGLASLPDTKFQSTCPL
jgi:hypothetical protein